MKILNRHLLPAIALLLALTGCMGTGNGGAPTLGGIDTTSDLSCNMVPDDFTKPGTVWIFDGKKRSLANVPLNGITPSPQGMADVKINRQQNIKLGSFLSSFSDNGTLQYSGSGAGYTVTVLRDFKNPQRSNVSFDQKTAVEQAITTWLSTRILPKNAKVIWISDILVADATTYNVSKGGGFNLEVQQGLKALNWDKIGIGFGAGNQLIIGPQNFKETKGKPYTVCTQGNLLEVTPGKGAGGVAVTSKPIDGKLSAALGYAETDTTTYK